MALICRRLPSSHGLTNSVCGPVDPSGTADVVRLGDDAQTSVIRCVMWRKPPDRGSTVSVGVRSLILNAGIRVRS